VFSSENRKNWKYDRGAAQYGTSVQDVISERKLKTADLTGHTSC
jgi:hypothetical protein